MAGGQILSTTVETQYFASLRAQTTKAHSATAKWGKITPVETQNFASLQGWQHPTELQTGTHRG